MADECIVCLGSLNEHNPEVSPSAALLSPHQDGGNAAHSKRADIDPDAIPADRLIAFLPSCGHYLHNECLTSWIERANSCPICRKTFNSVDLWANLGGPAISSYAVQDKVQEAVIDPDIVVDIDDEEEYDDSQVCQVCEEDDNEDILMYCDSCDKLYHTYCVGLHEVPVGHWFCEHCRAQRDDPTRPPLRSRPSRGYSRRTRGQRRRYRQQDRVHEQSWNRVWQSVWDSINLDLDFPFDDEEATAVHIRRQRQRNDHDRRQYQAWQRRAEIAEIQGGANRFRDNTQQLLEDNDGVETRGRPRPGTPPRETADELRAWAAFDRAREIHSDPVAARTRKRKSATASPVEPQPAPSERRIKRPRVRRQLEVSEASDSGESSSRRQGSPSRRQQTDGSSGPSFLQSLLKEVQVSSTPNQRDSPYFPVPHPHTPSNEHNSPTPSSPLLSPVPSHPSSPRPGSATPPPLPAHFARPGSPTGLSSSIQPIFPQLEDGHARPPPSDSSPVPASSQAEAITRTVNGNVAHLESERELPVGVRRLPRSAHQHSPPQSRPRSNETSPARQQLSLSAKQDIQKMVSAALKPYYNEGKVDKDDYTLINRDVSRMMYERVGVDGIDALQSTDKQQLETDVKDQVQKAVTAVASTSATNGESTLKAIA